MKWVVSVAAALALAGCAPDLGPLPEIAAASRHVSTQSLAGAPSAWPAAGWWRGYGDSQLDALVTEAMAGSPDMATASARVRTAEGLAEKTGADRLPSLSTNGTVGEAKQSYHYGIPPLFVPKGWNDTGQLALKANFDLDFWGGNRAAYAAAVSEADAVRLDGEQIALVLTTDIVSDYAELSSLYALQDVLRDAIGIRGTTASLTTQRVAIGLDTQAELKLATSAVAAAREELGENVEQIALTKHAIAALVGAGPDRALSIDRPAPHGPTPDGLPADAGIALIARRPDIAAVRARVDAAASSIKVADAAFYPNVTLSGLIGLESLGLSDFAKLGSSYGNVGPAISLPIFDGGAIRGGYRQARGQYDEAVANYDKALVGALHEVADAVTSRQQLNSQLDDARIALGDAKAAYDVAQQRYRGGLSTYLNALSAEESVITAERTMTRLEARHFSLDVALVRALGGGFQTPNSDPSGT